MSLYLHVSMLGAEFRVKLSKEEEKDETLMNDLRNVSPDEALWYKVRIAPAPDPT